jgi:hypothetical protein
MFFFATPHTTYKTFQPEQLMKTDTFQQEVPLSLPTCVTMCDHVEYLRIDCGNAHCTKERRRLLDVIFPMDMWKQYSLQNNLQAFISPADLQFLFLLVWITKKSICTCMIHT